MLKNKLGLILFLLLVLSAGAVFSLRFFGGNEDSWLCDNGSWVKHGNPSAPAPKTGCDDGKIDDTSSAGESMKINVFFGNANFDPEATCVAVFPIERSVKKTEAVARTALESLLLGTTKADEDQGYFTSINKGVKINKLTIENGVAKVDFDEQLEFQVGGSCRVSAISTQIIETLKQFSSVKNVIISINGRTEDILQP